MESSSRKVTASNSVSESFSKPSVANDTEVEPNMVGLDLERPPVRNHTCESEGSG